MVTFSRGNFLQRDLDGVMGAVGIGGVPEDNAFVVGRASHVRDPVDAERPKLIGAVPRAVSAGADSHPGHFDFGGAQFNHIGGAADGRVALRRSRRVSGSAAAAPKASDRSRNSRRLIFIVFLVSC